MLRPSSPSLLVAYLPGALVYRVPVANRPLRAALPAEERVFWAVVLSVLLVARRRAGARRRSDGYALRRLLDRRTARCAPSLLVACRPAPALRRNGRRA